MCVHWRASAAQNNLKRALYRDSLPAASVEFTPQRIYGTGCRTGERLSRKHGSPRVAMVGGFVGPSSLIESERSPRLQGRPGVEIARRMKAVSCWGDSQNSSGRLIH